MNWIYLENGGVLLSKVDPFFAELIRQIPAAADPGASQAAKDRLFQKPASIDFDNTELLEDWKEFVEPDLHALFASADQLVRLDLTKFTLDEEDDEEIEDDLDEDAEDESLDAEIEEIEGEEEADDESSQNQAVMTLTFEIPKGHLHAWISILNRARLVLVESHGLKEAELAAPITLVFQSRRDLVLFQVQFYGELLSFLLDVAEEL